MSDSPRVTGTRAFLGAFMSYARWRGVLGLTLLVLVGLTEGVGLLMLIPLLRLIGLAGDGGAANAAAELITGAFAFVGVPLSLPTILVAYASVVIVRATLVRYREVILAGIRLGFVDALRARLYRSMGRADWLFLARNRDTDFAHIVVVDVSRVDLATRSSLLFLVDGLIVTVYVMAAASVSFPITALAIVSGGILATALMHTTDQPRRVGVALTESNRRMFDAVSAYIGGMKMVKSYGAESRQAAAFSERIQQVRERRQDLLRIQASTRQHYETGAVILLCVFLYIAADVVQVAPAMLVLLIFIFARLVGPFARMHTNYLQWQQCMPAFDAVVDATERCEAAAEPPLPADADPLPLEREVRLRHVRFGYGGETDSLVLKDVDLVIPARQTTAIIGPSGAGKSTIADLLMGLLQPTGGEVLVDGEPLAGDRLYRWRRSVAYVAQEALLFEDSVRANLCWPDDHAETELWEALELASADGFVRGLPEGLDTEIGGGGVLLSGGERQRIALARALLRKPVLLMLDEATSAIDRHNERRIQDAVERLAGHLTVVVIAHRPSTLRHAAQVVVVDDGRVVEANSWDRLETIDKTYRQLLETEFLEQD